MSEWQPVTADAPVDGLLVETWFRLNNGDEHIRRLKRIGNLWWYADNRAYVYYLPTHWRAAVGRRAKRK